MSCSLPHLAWHRWNLLLPILALAGLSIMSGCTPAGPRALAKGERFLREGRPEQAAAQFQIVTNLWPTNAQAFNHLGLAWHGQKQFTEAEKLYRRALVLDHNLAVAHYNLGCLFLEVTNSAAVDELTAFTLMQPRSIPGWLQLGQAHRQARRFDAAEKAYKTVLDLEAKHPAALNGLGLLQVERKRPLDGLYYFNLAMEQQKDYAAPLLNLAIITHQQLNNRPLALEKYRQYLALRPRAPNWAEIEKVANQLELQMHAAGPAAGRVPAPVDQSRTSRSNPPPTYASASRDASVARPTGSVSTPGPTGSVATRRDAEINILPAPRETNIARRIDPRTPTQVPDSGPTIGSPGASGRTNEIARAARPTAVPRYARYSYLSPRPARTGDRPAADRYFNEGLRAQRAGQLPRAILAYQRATRFDPSYFEAHFNLGAAAFQNRNWREALTAYEYALAVRPDSADARYNFALALKQANHPWEAVAELEKLLQSRPQEVRLHLALANIHFQQLNQIDSARQHYQRALQLDPRHAEAAKVRAWLSEH